MRKMVRVIIISLMTVVLLCGCTVAGTATPTSSATPSIAPSPMATVTPTPTITPLPEPKIKLIAEAELPTPEAGQWFEWDKSGIYPANSNTFGCVILLLYIEHEELVVRTEELTEDSEDSIVLKISRLDGTEERVLDNNVSGPMNYFKGWIYYAKKDGIYKIKIDGTEKQKIFNLNNETGMLDIYNGRIYIGILDSTDLNGKHFRHQSVPDIPIGYSFIEKGCFYYAAITEDDEGGDCWSIYRYNLKTGAAKELLRDAMGSLIVRDGMAYYCSGNGIERTDGEKTEIVLQDEYSESISCMYYTLYRNYILFFTGADGEKLCACDINTGKVYELFSSDILPQIDISVMENSVFLYTGFKDDPIYRITFENNKAKLWELNGL